VCSQDFSRQSCSQLPEFLNVRLSRLPFAGRTRPQTYRSDNSATQKSKTRLSTSTFQLGKSYYLSPSSPFLWIPDTRLVSLYKAACHCRQGIFEIRSALRDDFDITSLAHEAILFATYTFIRSQSNLRLQADIIKRLLKLYFHCITTLSRHRHTQHISWWCICDQNNR
jgi:hypothetical protein